MSTLRDSRLRVALRLLEPGRWVRSDQLLGRTAVYTSAHSLSNAFGRLCAMGLLERRDTTRNVREWKLTEAGEKERA